jgi:hypothetical protein
MVAKITDGVGIGALRGLEDVRAEDKARVVVAPTAGGKIPARSARVGLANARGFPAAALKVLPCDADTIATAVCSRRPHYAWHQAHQRGRFQHPRQIMDVSRHQLLNLLSRPEFLW